MKNYKKIGLIVSAALLSMAAFALLHPPRSLAVAANGIVGFITSDIGGANFYFQDNGTIVANITHSGTTYQVSFDGPTNPQPGFAYPYKNNGGNFCTPAPGSYTSPPYSGASLLEVKINSLNPIVGDIQSVTSSSAYTQLWPGPNQTSCGNNVAGKVYPVQVSKSGVTVQNTGSPSGPGSQYTAASLKNASYTFVNNGATIKMSLAGGASNSDVTFIDQQPYDKNFGFASSNSPFCNGSGGTTGGSLTLTPTGTFDANKIDAVIKAGHFVGSKCVTDQIPITVTNPGDKLTDGSSVTLAEEFAQWDVDSNNNPVIDVLKCSVSGGTCSTDFALNLLSNAGGATYVQNGSTCGGYTLKLDGTDKNTGNFYDNGSSTCGKSNNRLVGVLGTKGQAPAGSAATDTSGNGVLTPCEAHSGGFVFAWAMCPILEAANTLTTVLVNSFEGQLNFNVSQLGTSTDASSGNYKIHQSWSILKDIASALVVIVMLIMVLSQAASFGPFDAYTIRKLLPRLVAAVILMQISWPLFNFVIQMVNDLANGLAAIMYLPFGGASQMDLWHLLYNAKLSDVLLGAMDWGALAVFLVLGWAFLFTILGFALTGVVALLFGLLALVFRKILIILLLIFAPLALLAWVLPGTKQYWDMWWKNFIKVLFMFPIIVAIIAAGRIFAYVVGTQDNGQFLNLIFIMVGFFGPLFLLPKTYKWGGQAMQMAGNGVMKASSKISERPKNFMNERQKLYSAEKSVRRAERLSDPSRQTGFRRALDIARLDPLISGSWDPTLGGRNSRVRRRKVDAYRAKALGAEEEARKSAALRLQQEAIHHEDEDGFYRTVARDMNRSQDERDAALDRVSTLGGAGNMRFLQEEQTLAIEEARNGDRSRIIAFNKFLDRVSPSLFPKMQQLYKARPAESSDPNVIATAEVDGLRRTVEGIGPRAIAQMDQASAENLLTRLSNAGMTAERNLLISRYQEAMSTPSTRPDVGTGVVATFEGIGVVTPPPSGGPAAQVSTNTVINPTPQPQQPGVLNVTHNTGNAGPVQVADLDTRGASGYTPREEAYVQNTRADYEAMRQRISMGETLTPDEQRRFEQIRGANPNW